MKKLLVALLSAVSAVAMDLIVTWNPSPPEEMVSQYQIYSSTNQLGPFLPVGTSTNNGFIATVPDSPPTYFVVTAINSFGQSMPSEVGSLAITNAPSVVGGVIITHPFVIKPVITNLGTLLLNTININVSR